MSISISKALFGLGLASALFLGCQQFTGQEGAPRDGAADAPQADDPGPALRVKPSEECLALHRQILAADSAGDSTITVRTDFVKLCIEELKPGRGPLIPIPPDQIPGKASRCEFLIAKLDTLDTASAEYARLKHFLHHHCGVLDPDHPRPDTLGPPPPKDSLPPRPPRAPTLCDSLHVALAGLDKVSDAYAVLKTLHDSVCHIPRPPKDTLAPPPPPKDSLGPRPPKDTLPPPRVPTLCDSLHKALAGLDTAADGYAPLKALHDSVCHIPRPPKDTLAPPPPKDSLVPRPPKDTLLPPAPPAPPVSPACDSLTRALSLLDPVNDPQAYGIAKQRMTDACPRPEPVPPTPVYTPADCARMRAELAAMESAPDKQANYRTFVDSVCPAAP